MIDHPITPPLELVHLGLVDLATRAAQWAADQELEACCALMDDWGLDGDDLRAARRPKKQPGLVEQALKCLGPSLDEFGFCTLGSADHATIRAALKRLKELEESSHD